MGDLATDFQFSNVTKVELGVPMLARQALRRISDITGATNICIAGGFPRGLYMQQFLGVTPKMNDIDIFADVSLDRFNTVKDRLEAEFGTPVRFHVGRFEKEEQPRGLIEFSLPHYLRKTCAGVESIQLNFGLHHPWANPFEYVVKANVGMNQIAVLQNGDVMSSRSFLDDMTNRTMTMNPDRKWTAHDWIRTTKSLERMQKERPEFQGWKEILTPQPYMPTSGIFWDVQKPAGLEPQ